MQRAGVGRRKTRKAAQPATILRESERFVFLLAFIIQMSMFRYSYDTETEGFRVQSLWQDCFRVQSLWQDCHLLVARRPLRILDKHHGKKNSNSVQTNLDGLLARQAPNFRIIFRPTGRVWVLARSTESAETREGDQTIPCCNLPRREVSRYKRTCSYVHELLNTPSPLGVER